MNKIVSEFAGIIALIIGVAMLAVLVSRQANTAGVIDASGRTFTNILTAAVNPFSNTTGGIRTGGLGSSAF